MSYLLRTDVEAVHPGSRSESRYEFLFRDSKVKLTVVVDLRFLRTSFDYLLVLFRYFFFRDSQQISSNFFHDVECSSI